MKYQPVEVDNILNHPLFDIEGEWIRPLDGKLVLEPKMFPTFGYGEDDFIPGLFEEDDIITGLESPFDLGSIINPSEYLIGSEMIITIGLESKTIALGSDILQRLVPA